MLGATAQVRKAISAPTTKLPNYLINYKTRDLITVKNLQLQIESAVK
jgi:hypothetical protein